MKQIFQKGPNSTVGSVGGNDDWSEGRDSIEGLVSLGKTTSSSSVGSFALHRLFLLFCDLSTMEHSIEIGFDGLNSTDGGILEDFFEFAAIREDILQDIFVFSALETGYWSSRFEMRDQSGPEPRQFCVPRVHSCRNENIVQSLLV